MLSVVLIINLSYFIFVCSCCGCRYFQLSLPQIPLFIVFLNFHCSLFSVFLCSLPYRILGIHKFQSPLWEFFSIPAWGRSITALVARTIWRSSNPLLDRGSVQGQGFRTPLSLVRILSYDGVSALGTGMPPRFWHYQATDRTRNWTAVSEVFYFYNHKRHPVMRHPVYKSLVVTEICQND